MLPRKVCVFTTVEVVSPGAFSTFGASSDGGGIARALLEAALPLFPPVVLLLRKQRA